MIWPLKRKLKRKLLQREKLPKRNLLKEKKDKLWTHYFQQQNSTLMFLNRLKPKVWSFAISKIKRFA
jgi:hypothetical protein